MSSGRSNEGGDKPPGNLALHMVVMLATDLVGPIALYYGLRAAGIGNVVALTVGTVPPLLGAVVKFIKQRKVDALGVFVAVVFVLSIAASLVTDSPRFLLLKDGWLTGAAGGAFLASLWGRRPLAFDFSRPLLERRFSSGEETWDDLWDRKPGFRRIWQVTTVFWGVGLILDAGLRVVIAYALPVDLVPLWNGIQYGVFTLLMLVITNIYQARAGLWDILQHDANTGEPAPSAR
ncbi:VC0807 family protein [Streptacidiphilus albus]|uniref:VC0807 family protein n=1 Tax=Streptacidiphilus albus TaxID=105425 RepID=UPI00068DE487|nr:VC0807 family protein [Streptacidiphilus albus]